MAILLKLIIVSFFALFFPCQSLSLMALDCGRPLAVVNGTDDVLLLFNCSSGENDTSMIEVFIAPVQSAANITASSNITLLVATPFRRLFIACALPPGKEVSSSCDLSVVTVVMSTQLLLKGLNASDGNVTTTTTIGATSGLLQQATVVVGASYYSSDSVVIAPAVVCIEVRNANVVLDGAFAFVGVVRWPTRSLVVRLSAGAVLLARNVYSLLVHCSNSSTEASSPASGWPTVEIELLDSYVTFADTESRSSAAWCNAMTPSSGSRGRLCHLAVNNGSSLAEGNCSTATAAITIIPMVTIVVSNSTLETLGNSSGGVASSYAVVAVGGTDGCRTASEVHFAVHLLSRSIVVVGGNDTSLLKVDASGGVVATIDVRSNSAIAFSGASFGSALSRCLMEVVGNSDAPIDVTVYIREASAVSWPTPGSSALASLVLVHGELSSLPLKSIVVFVQEYSSVVIECTSSNLIWVQSLNPSGTITVQRLTIVVKDGSLVRLGKVGNPANSAAMLSLSSPANITCSNVMLYVSNETIVDLFAVSTAALLSFGDGNVSVTSTSVSVLASSVNISALGLAVLVVVNGPAVAMNGVAVRVTDSVVVLDASSTSFASAISSVSVSLSGIELMVQGSNVLVASSVAASAVLNGLVRLEGNVGVVSGTHVTLLATAIRSEVPSWNVMSLLAPSYLNVDSLDVIILEADILWMQDSIPGVGSIVSIVTSGFSSASNVVINVVDSRMSSLLSSVAVLRIIYSQRCLVDGVALTLQNATVDVSNWDPSVVCGVLLVQSLDTVLPSIVNVSNVLMTFLLSSLYSSLVVVNANPPHQQSLCIVSNVTCLLSQVMLHSTEYSLRFKAKQSIELNDVAVSVRDHSVLHYSGGGGGGVDIASTLGTVRVSALYVALLSHSAVSMLDDSAKPFSVNLVAVESLNGTVHVDVALILISGHSSLTVRNVNSTFALCYLGAADSLYSQHAKIEITDHSAVVVDQGVDMALLHASAMHEVEAVGLAVECVDSTLFVDASGTVSLTSVSHAFGLRMSKNCAIVAVAVLDYLAFINGSNITLTSRSHGVLLLTAVSGGALLANNVQTRCSSTTMALTGLTTNVARFDIGALTLPLYNCYRSSVVDNVTVVLSVVDVKFVSNDVNSAAATLIFVYGGNYTNLSSSAVSVQSSQLAATSASFGAVVLFDVQQVDIWNVIVSFEGCRGVLRACYLLRADHSLATKTIRLSNIVVSATRCDFVFEFLTSIFFVSYSGPVSTVNVIVTACSMQWLTPVLGGLAFLLRVTRAVKFSLHVSNCTLKPHGGSFLQMLNRSTVDGILFNLTQTRIVFVRDFFRLMHFYSAEDTQDVVDGYTLLAADVTIEALTERAVICFVSVEAIASVESRQGVVSLTNVSCSGSSLATTAVFFNIHGSLSLTNLDVMMLGATQPSASPYSNAAWIEIDCGRNVNASGIAVTVAHCPLIALRELMVIWSLATVIATSVAVAISDSMLVLEGAFLVQFGCGVACVTDNTNITLDNASVYQSPPRAEFLIGWVFDSAAAPSRVERVTVHLIDSALTVSNASDFYFVVFIRCSVNQSLVGESLNVAVVRSNLSLSSFLLSILYIRGQQSTYGTVSVVVDSSALNFTGDEAYVMSLRSTAVSGGVLRCSRAVVVLSNSSVSMRCSNTTAVLQLSSSLTNGTMINTIDTSVLVDNATVAITGGSVTFSSPSDDLSFGSRPVVVSGVMLLSFFSRVTLRIVSTVIDDSVIDAVASASLDFALFHCTQGMLVAFMAVVSLEVSNAVVAFNGALWRNAASVGQVSLHPTLSFKLMFDRNVFVLPAQHRKLEINMRQAFVDVGGLSTMKWDCNIINSASKLSSGDDAVVVWPSNVVVVPDMFAVKTEWNNSGCGSRLSTTFSYSAPIVSRSLSDGRDVRSLSSGSWSIVTLHRMSASIMEMPTITPTTVVLIEQSPLSFQSSASFIATEIAVAAMSAAADLSGSGVDSLLIASVPFCRPTSNDDANAAKGPQQMINHIRPVVLVAAAFGVLGLHTIAVGVRYFCVGRKASEQRPELSTSLLLGVAASLRYPAWSFPMLRFFFPLALTLGIGAASRTPVDAAVAAISSLGTLSASIAILSALRSRLWFEWFPANDKMWWRILLHAGEWCPTEWKSVAGPLINTFTGAVLLDSGVARHAPIVFIIHGFAIAPTLTGIALLSPLWCRASLMTLAATYAILMISSIAPQGETLFRNFVGKCLIITIWGLSLILVLLKAWNGSSHSFGVLLALQQGAMACRLALTVGCFLVERRMKRRRKENFEDSPRPIEYPSFLSGAECRWLHAKNGEEALGEVIRIICKQCLVVATSQQQPCATRSSRVMKVQLRPKGGSTKKVGECVM